MFGIIIKKTVNYELSTFLAYPHYCEGKVDMGYVKEEEGGEG